VNGIDIMKNVNIRKVGRLFSDWFKCFFVLIALIGCWGCESRHLYYKHYEGKTLPTSQVAVIKGYDYYRTNYKITSMLRIKAIDGKKIPSSNGATRVELLPGQYDVDVMYLLPSGMVDYYNEDTVKMTVEKGNVYVLGVRANMKTKKMIYFYNVVGPANSNPDPDKKLGRVYDKSGVKSLEIISQEDLTHHDTLKMMEKRHIPDLPKPE